MLFLLTREGNAVIWNRLQYERTTQEADNAEGSPYGESAAGKETLDIRPLQLAKTCRDLALDKKGEGALILDLRGLSSVTDYFVICHGTSRRHVQAIAENIHMGLKKREVSEAHAEGEAEGRWVVLDYIDAIVHIFDEEMRDIYRLEELWGDAARIE
jgi:ribosome-associated protein